MTEPKSCPMCGNKHISKYRYNILMSADPTETGYYVEEKPNGEMFCMECNMCGCKISRSEDILTEQAEETKHYEQITSKVLWEIMTSIWNRRVNE